MKKKMDFSGKTVIVTGGTYGIGGACTEAFCESGANVVACARNEEKGKILEKKLCDKYGAERCFFIQCDVNREDEILRVVSGAAGKYGRIDVLINNAGVHPMNEYIDDVTGAMFQELINTNLTSMFLFSKYCLPYLRKTKGSIVNMSSMVGAMGQNQAVRYCTTKGGISGMSRAMAVDEAKNGVRVNIVSPGAIITPLSSATLETDVDPAGDWCHMRRRGTAEEVAEVCLFLASEEASFLTGIDVPVTGGAELAYGTKIFG